MARAFDQVSTGVIVVDGHGFVIEMNGLAERVAQRGDGLTLRLGALGAARVFEKAKLTAAIASATRPGAAATSSRILIGRQGGKQDYILAVSPLGVDLGFYSDPMALIIVVDPEARSPKADDLSAYFGLSFAESRLATQLMSGKPLRAIAAESGASTATLRSQLRSILKKIRVERQADLFLVLARVPCSPDGEVDGEAIPPPDADYSLALRQFHEISMTGLRPTSLSICRIDMPAAITSGMTPLLRRVRVLAAGRIERRIGTPKRPKVSRRPLKSSACSSRGCWRPHCRTGRRRAGAPWAA